MYIYNIYIYTYIYIYIYIFKRIYIHTDLYKYINIYSYISGLRFVAECFSVFRFDAVCCSVYTCAGARVESGVSCDFNSVSHGGSCEYDVVVCCSVLQCVAVCCSVSFFLLQRELQCVLVWPATKDPANM